MIHPALPKQTMDLLRAMETLPYVELFYTPDKGWGAVTVEGMEPENIVWVGSAWEAIAGVIHVPLQFTSEVVDRIMAVKRHTEPGRIWTAECRNGVWVRPFEPNAGKPIGVTG